jgi:hypothetical protein
MQVTVNISEEAAAKARALGIGIEEYLERLVASDASVSVHVGPFGSALYTPAEAVDRIRELRKGLSLGGLKIKDLINEGRR